MSKRMIVWKRWLVTVCLGGSMFHLAWGGWGMSLDGCTQNRDLVTFYQAVGNESIAAISDGVFNDGVTDSDYDRIVRQPATGLAQAWWSNWVWLRHPRDPQVHNVAVE